MKMHNKSTISIFHGKMENPYASYYVNQAGSGISAYSGQRFQRGHGFFGRIFSSVLPVLKYLGRQALSTGVSVAQDALQGENVKQSIKRRAADVGANIAEDIANRARVYAQTGRGIKRKKKKVTKKVPVKRTKVIKKRKKYKSVEKTHKKGKISFKNLS